MTIARRRKKIVLYSPQQCGDVAEPPYCRYTQEMPLALLAIAAWPMRDGYEVVLIDGSRFRPDKAHRRVLEACDGALLYATTGILGYQLTDGLRCSRKVKAKYPTLPAFIGGWFASAAPRMQLDTGLYDAVALGQGEITFRELVQAVDSGAALDTVAGLALLQNGEMVKTAPRRVVGWDQLLNMPWDLIEIERYRDPQMTEPERGTVGKAYGPGRPRFEISYYASFGCPIRCTFCCSPGMTGLSYKVMPPARMLDDLQELQRRWGFDGVNFTDANYGVMEKRSRDVATGILERDMKLSYWIFFQAASILKYQPSTLDLMAESGFFGCVLGAEAGSDEMMERIKKPTRGDDNVRAGMELSRRRISPYMTYIIGYPGEEPASMMKTIEQARQAAIACPHARPEVWPFRPIPGSEDYDAALKDGFVPPATIEDWGKAGDYWNDEAWPGRIPPDVARARREFMLVSSLAQCRVRQRDGFWERRARRRLERNDYKGALLEARLFHYCQRVGEWLRPAGARSAP